MTPVGSTNANGDPASREDLRELVQEIVREVEATHHEGTTTSELHSEPAEVIKKAGQVEPNLRAPDQKRISESGSPAAEMAALVRQTAENTKNITVETRKITEILENLRCDLANAATRGGVIDQPRSAADHYHNARVFEQLGDIKNALKSYEQFFECGVDVVDAFGSYARILRTQSGVEKAQQHV